MPSSGDDPRGSAADDTRDGHVVVCKNLRRVYDRGDGRSWLSRRRNSGRQTPTVTALSDLSLSVPRGTVVGIAGPSGSGKTTLLHLLAGVDTPTDGRIRVCGSDLGSFSSRQRTRFRLDHVGIVFQHFHLFPSLSARANVALPLVEHGIGKGDRRERAETWLERVGLGDRVTHRPSELSGGERQRVAVARALVADPDIVIADEPTGELDRAAGDRVLELLTDVAADGRAVLVASHDQAVLERTDRVVRLADGQRVSHADRQSEPTLDRADGHPTEATDGSGTPSIEWVDPSTETRESD